MYGVSLGSSAYIGCSLVDSVFIRDPVRPLLLHDTGIVYAGRESVKPYIGAYGTQCISFCIRPFSFIPIYRGCVKLILPDPRNSEYVPLSLTVIGLPCIFFVGYFVSIWTG